MTTLTKHNNAVLWCSNVSAKHELGICYCSISAGRLYDRWKLMSDSQKSLLQQRSTAQYTIDRICRRCSGCTLSYAICHMLSSVKLRPAATAYIYGIYNKNWGEGGRAPGGGAPRLASRGARRLVFHNAAETSFSKCILKVIIIRLRTSHVWVSPFISRSEIISDEVRMSMLFRCLSVPAQQISIETYDHEAGALKKHALRHFSVRLCRPIVHVCFSRRAITFKPL